MRSCFIAPKVRRRLTLYEKTEPFAKYVQTRWRWYWIPGRNLAVDEAVQRFSGRCVEAVNIPSKPDPIGLKEWCLADFGYLISVRGHRRGSQKNQGPLFKRRGKKLVKWGWNKTQAVVFDVVNDLPNGGKGRVIWTDNLFTSTYALSYARALGIGMAGTCRTTSTRREEEHEKEMGVNEEEEVSCTARLFGSPFVLSLILKTWC